MTKTIIIFLSSILVVVLAWASWMFRYHPLDDRMNPPVLDRWTGRIIATDALDRYMPAAPAPSGVPHLKQGFTPNPDYRPEQ